jgi:peptidoglycan/xylan/chitin deacetylase (PgdA/CDA1 family)
MINTGTVPVSVVFYHRVDNQHLNDWTITESRFLEQINWYQENFDLVSLEEAQKRIDSGFNDRPTLSITFDDGYADNCSFALPLLIERQIPFTYFVTTLHTLGQEAFPHDKAEGLPLPTNTKESLIALAAAGVEIGAHTRTHPDLGKLSDPQQLFDEVITATRELEEAIGKDIKYFAFPFGQVENLNSDVFRLCKEHGFKGVCSAYGGLNFVGDESFHLQRMHGDPKISRMKNWLTYDTRVLNKQRFQYDGKPNNTAQDSQTQQNPATPLNIEPQT